MMEKLNRLRDPVFLVLLLLLLLNDLIFKPAFGNWLTGKLSDFAGVFVFAFFWTALFPARAKAIHWATALGFIFWKTEFSQPLIQWLQQQGAPVYRVIDYGDLVALLMLPLSLKRLGRKLGPIWPMHPAVTAAVVLFAFFATTLPPREKKTYVHIDKRYEFDMPIRTLAQKLNMIIIRELGTYHYSQVTFSPEDNLYRLNYVGDTITGLLNVDRITEEDTLILPSSFAEIVIDGNQEKSAVTLVKTVWYASPFTKKDYAGKTVKFFERKVIKKLKAQ